MLRHNSVVIAFADTPTADGGLCRHGLPRQPQVSISISSNARS